MSVDEEHIAHHIVDEAEQANVLLPVVRHTRANRYIAYGKTDGGRLLNVIFTILPDGTARVITTRDMDDQERRYYRRERR